MKAVRTAINEEQYKTFMKHADKMHLSEYALNKKLVLAFLEKEELWQAEEERRYVIGINVAYGFIVYGLIMATILLLIF